ncbi:hypothetical protein EDC56_3934 [Sinobacterium caligoides]|uniref:Uncharacterized protein n=1 Tax=Sinobacterium caligoides TaxID=933926 RepID=A0A3N2D4U0_9GAMM|nr:hypothetical protein EDC56_3934 [Sinobacterium caligoides]
MRWHHITQSSKGALNTTRKRSKDIKKERKVEPADKPGFVLDSHSSRPAIAHRLKQPTRFQYGPYLRKPIWSCSGWSLPCHKLLPVVRCALTAPFHPYRSTNGLRRSTLCCTGRGLTPPRCYLAPCPIEPGLSSPKSTSDLAATAWLTPARII